MRLKMKDCDGKPNSFRLILKRPFLYYYQGAITLDANELVVVQTTNNLTEAEILKNALEAAGIKCDLEGENQGSFAGILNVRILVRAWDADRARQVLSSHAHQLPEFDHL